MESEAKSIVGRATCGEDLLDIISGLLSDISRDARKNHPEWSKSIRVISQLDQTLNDSID